MDNPLIRKLALGAPLSDDDRAAVTRAISETRRIEKRTDLVVEGARPEFVHGVLRGYACRYKLLPDGGRQIVALMIPGDFCDIHVHLLGSMDHTIATIGPCEIAFLSRTVIDELIDSRPAVARALWWASLVDEGTLREWLLNMGRRPAMEKLAHLFCEIRLRLDSIGLVQDGGFDFPLTQSEMGDLLGLSLVHLNRTLRRLRTDGLVDMDDHRVRILDLTRLEQFANFDPTYLHLDPRSGG